MPNRKASGEAPRLDTAGGEAASRFVSQVSAFMRRHRISRTELARRLGVSRPMVTAFLSGKPNLTMRTMAAIADALDCDLKAEILPRPSSPPPAFLQRR